jgi:hypothetical protein
VSDWTGIALLVVGGAGCLLFAAQSVSWFLLRSKRLKVPRWRKASAVYLAFASTLALLGMAAIFFGEDGLRPAGTMALGAGGINGFITLFHRRVLTWLEHHQRDR